MIINDPNGTPLGVTAGNRGKVSSVSEPMDMRINHVDGKVWSYSFFDIDPVGANDYFFYLKNTGTAELAVTDFRLSCGTTASRVYVKAVSGTPTFTAGADITPVSRNLSKSAVPDATCKSDTDITGLTDDGTVFHMELDAVDKLFHLSTSSKIIIPQGKSIALQFAAATGTVSGVVSVIAISSPDNF
jgi:hypothetical protein